jgi:hypothetical protein
MQGTTRCELMEVPAAQRRKQVLLPELVTEIVAPEIKRLPAGRCDSVQRPSPRDEPSSA